MCRIEKRFPGVSLHVSDGIRLLRIHAARIALLALTLLTLLPMPARSQGSASPGFRCIRDRSGHVIAVEYYGTSGLKSAQLHRHPKLESLEIVYGTNLTHEDVACLSTLTGLNDLRIGQELIDPLVTIDGDLSPLANLTSLKSLLICKNGISDEDLRFIASLPRITDLEFNADTGLWDDDPSNLTDACGDYLRRAATLKSIRVQGCGTLTDEFIAKITEGLAGLEQLQLNSSKLTDESLRLLATRCPNLRSLTLNSDAFTDKGVRHIADAGSLKELSLHSDSITHESITAVAKLSGLKQLALSAPTVSREGLQTLAGLRQLEILTLRQPPLTNEQFAILENHPALKYLYINGSGISADQMEETIGRLPELRHVGVGSDNGHLQHAVDRVLAQRHGNHQIPN